MDLESVINIFFKCMKNSSILLFLFLLFCFNAIAQSGSITCAEMNGMIEACKNQYTEKSHQYADCILWCAMQCATAGDNKQSAQLLKQSDNLFHKYGTGNFNGRDTINEILRLDILSKIEKNTDRDYFAIKYAECSLKLKKTYFGRESEQTLNALLELSQLYAERHMYKKAVKVHNEGYGSYVEVLRREFCSSSESKRNDFWKVASLYVGKTLTEAHKYAGKKLSATSSMASAAYNANLLSKGILLNTTIDFENYVRNSKSSKAIRLLDERKNALEISIQDSLDYAMLNILRKENKEYNIPQLLIKWQDVVSRLGEHDVAIEFYRTSLKEYGALIVKKGWSAPKIVKLKDNIKISKKYVKLENALRYIIDNLKNERDVSLSVMWELSRAIWTDKLLTLLPEEADAKVYFSADGLLQLIGIESLPFNGKDSIRMSDIYNMYRLSSTRVLVLEKSQNESQGQVTLYGDIQYDMSKNAMLYESKRYPNIYNKTRSLRPALNNEYILPLEGTRIEVDLIASLLSQEDSLKINKLIRSKGNEESFKNLSGSKQRILHIATHGFYNQEDTTLSTQNENEYQIDFSMQRTGLLLAGAQKAINEEDLPDGVEDGILTAYEISHIDLSNLDIAVLSACETALGDVTKDGVAGLQRGFKQAGTKSLLMSLWKVDDEATCKLMTEFYSNWIVKKMTKHDALEEAKHTIRETKGWENPKYWAAFILLDGLD